MTSIYDLKPRFQALLRPTIRGLDRAGLTPNAVTLIALVGSIALGTLFAFETFEPSLLLAVLPAWLFIRMALNAIDGMMARELDKRSDLGAVLNEVGDVLSDLALYLPLALVHPPAAIAIVAFCFAACVAEFAGLMGPYLGRERAYDGPMGKSDRAFSVGLLALLTLFGPAEILEAWPHIFAVLALLAGVTTIRRARAALSFTEENRDA